MTGYRSDGGGLGQDQSVSGPLKSIVSAKLPLLNAPGSVIENSLYYDIHSSSVTAVEQQATFAKDRISLNNMFLGTSPSAYIPSVLFANTLFWVASFDPEFKAAATTDNVVVSEGWGFEMLRNIIVYMGSSSISSITISGKSNFMIAMACCETDTKRQVCIRGAGTFLNSLASNSPLDVAVNGSPWSRIKGYGDFYSTTSIITNSYFSSLAQCVVPIRLPWTSMSVLQKRLSFDCKLLTQPIQVTLELRSRSELIEFTAGATANFISNFDKFKYSTLQAWQEELSDKSLSLKQELLAMPMFNAGYPFQYIQSIPFIIPSFGSGSDLTTVASSVSFDMNITSIINADLTTFLFMVSSVYRNTVIAETSVTSANNHWPLYGEILEELEILLNGQRFFSFDSTCYNSVSMAKHIDTTQPLFNIYFQKTATTADPAQVRSNIYELNNSRLRALAGESHLQNTARFTSQTFQLKFRINRDVNWPFISATPSVIVTAKSGFVLNMAYLYNGVLLVGGDGGTSKLITN